MMNYKIVAVTQTLTDQTIFAVRTESADPLPMTKGKWQGKEENPSITQEMIDSQKRILETISGEHQGKADNPSITQKPLEKNNKIVAVPQKPLPPANPGQIDTSYWYEDNDMNSIMAKIGENAS